METKRAAVVAAVLLAASLTAGCFGPDEDPATTVEGTETTPGEDTVEAGGVPKGEPVNDTANVPETTATVETTDGAATETTANGTEEGGEE